MFVVNCPSHRSEVLLDPRRIRGWRTWSGGSVLDWECWCGHRGSLVHATAGDRAGRVPAHAAHAA
jgi:hypothetical protein